MIQQPLLKGKGIVGQVRRRAKPIRRDTRPTIMSNLKRSERVTADYIKAAGSDRAATVEQYCTGPDTQASE
ncbi:hypothetical protein HORIV_44200 [Vreelandella olivaria]|uniref:Uncharacterized protein n=1 Tax=Vreelandella olivaria TaxID=390919 RepID=A0ABM7GJD9_9GAMM|nr:hypothetical protein HORIV_44200 [Halomonas olivaria]